MLKHRLDYKLIKRGGIANIAELRQIQFFNYAGVHLRWGSTLRDRVHKISFNDSCFNYAGNFNCSVAYSFSILYVKEERVEERLQFLKKIKFPIRFRLLLKLILGKIHLMVHFVFL